MTIIRLQEILNQIILDGKGDYKVAVQWRDGGGSYNGRDEEDKDVAPYVKDDEKVVIF